MAASKVAQGDVWAWGLQGLPIEQVIGEVRSSSIKERLILLSYASYLRSGRKETAERDKQ
jgi:hypothetical protein